MAPAPEFFSTQFRQLCHQFRIRQDMLFVQPQASIPSKLLDAERVCPLRSCCARNVETHVSTDVLRVRQGFPFLEVRDASFAQFFHFDIRDVCHSFACLSSILCKSIFHDKLVSCRKARNHGRMHRLHRMSVHENRFEPIATTLHQRYFNERLCRHVEPMERRRSCHHAGSQDIICSRLLIV